MIAAPWNILLTFVFVMTAVICFSGLIGRSRKGRTNSALTDSDLIDITHGVMSVAMIVMTWWTVWDAVTWAQVAIFAILVLALVPSFRGARGAQAVDLVGHIVLDVAMIWMLAAMPLLMAGMDMSGDAGGAHAGHHGGGGVDGDHLGGGAARPGRPRQHGGVDTVDGDRVARPGDEREARQEAHILAVAFDPPGHRRQAGVSRLARLRADLHRGVRAGGTDAHAILVAPARPRHAGHGGVPPD